MNLRVTITLFSFRFSLEVKVGKEITDSSKLVLKKVFSKYIVLSDVEDNTSAPLNRKCIADSALLKTLVAICQKYMSQVSGML